MINQIKPFFLMLLLACLCCKLTSCHYHAGNGNLSDRYKTFSVPYILGDQTGELTAEVIKKMSHSSGLTYSSVEGDLVLDIKLIELQDKDIGFRYDRKNSGKLKKVLIPSETRIQAVAEIKIIDSIKHLVVQGPVTLTAALDFDHTYYTNRHEVNVFSLGQLNDYDEAQDAAKSPLYRELADRVVDFVVNNW